MWTVPWRCQEGVKIISQLNRTHKFKWSKSINNQPVQLENFPFNVVEGR